MKRFDAGELLLLAVVIVLAVSAVGIIGRVIWEGMP